METTVGKGSSTFLAMHKQSRTISKSKPKIRIIHIFAPEIIKTDVANFRELVQRLTGKPEDSANRQNLQNHLKGPKKTPRDDHQNHHQAHHLIKESAMATKKTSFENADVEEGEEYKEVVRAWNGNGESSGGFLSGFGDFDGFIQELGEFPYWPLAMDHALLAASSSSSSSSSQFHGAFAQPQKFA